MKLYQCMHHINTVCHEQGRQLLHFLFLNSSLVFVDLVNGVRAITPTPKLYGIYSIKLNRCMHDIELMCHEQGRQLWHFYAPGGVVGWSESAG